MKVCQSKKGCQNKKGLSKYERFVKVRKICQKKKGLSKEERFVNVRKVCQSKAVFYGNWQSNFHSKMDKKLCSTEYEVLE